MRAAIYEEYGPPEVVQIRDIPKPTPKNNEILIKINTTTLHRGDTRMRALLIPGSFIEKFMGRLYLGFNGPKSKVLGMEVAGEVESVGDNVSSFRPGDQVFASTMEGLKFGGHAEYICLPEDGLVALKPTNMSFEEAVAVPTSAIAALIYLRDTGKIRSGDRVLIVGASGALGTYGVQIAKYFGAMVTGVCSTANLKLVRSIGADHVIDYTKEDFTKGNEKYDLIFDTLSISSKSECKGVLASGGRYIRTSGPNPKRDDLLFLKEIMEAGKLKTVIDRRYTLDQIVEAHRYVDKGHKKGNVIINVTETG
ncbi:MAG: NAD(P)-dependent alcohol dehydrogenase [Candidatus Bathyarchaeota archaeon]|nr:NAD(P)-dependent alcohol dehydrogenase [Candidatus Bathyarchaeota archaeon]